MKRQLEEWRIFLQYPENTKNLKVSTTTKNNQSGWEIGKKYKKTFLKRRNATDQQIYEKNTITSGQCKSKQGWDITSFQLEWSIPKRIKKCNKCW